MQNRCFLIVAIAFLFFNDWAAAQFVFPDAIEREHPRMLAPHLNKDNIFQKIENSEEIKASYNVFKRKVTKYVSQYKTDPEWLSSRFQMYWKSHATDVFVDGEFYSHATGRAPVPTVRFTGQRDYVTLYKTPKLEDVKPYLEDDRGLFLQNKKTNEWEWVMPSKTGRVIENTNENIMKIARDAALVYFIERDEEYAELAAHLFDVYMHGLYYRKEPIDLKNGNVQRIIGLTSFQVIKENIVDELAETYGFLYEYLQGNKKEMTPIYTGSLKKLAEIIIKNGVPDNNWNLHQANFVIQLALALDDDTAYEDGKGCQYYLNRVFNETEARQWSVTDVLAYGYDQNNGIWNESAGYALSVAKGYTHLIRVIQEALNIDVLQYMSILPKAVEVMPQYLYPNKYIVAFGDSHYGPLETAPFLDLVGNAQKFDKRPQEEKFTSLLYMLEGKEKTRKEKKTKNSFNNFLYKTEVSLDPTIVPANQADFMTATFYAPTVSWVAIRNGLDPKHGLMISQAGSLGNHAHSNGIAMELYGKGYVLGPEGGRGSSYFQSDYREYYSQFPAHNTVSVNGKSHYEKMRSYYAFEVNTLYPESECKTGYFPDITFSDLYFHEPSTNADQNRVMGIVRTGEETGYYIDVFRSRTKEDNDKYHDYFYHNLGQELILKNGSNKLFPLKTTTKLASKEGNIKAYDYFWDEESLMTSDPIKASFNLSIYGEEQVSMNMWMLGGNNREVFRVKAPPSEAFRNGMIPKEIEEAPLLTTVVRQYGEAWNRPFVAIYEPTTASEPSTIKSIASFNVGNGDKGLVGLKIEHNTGREDLVFSSDKSSNFTYKDVDLDGRFGLVIEESGSTTLFLGSGKKITKNGWSIEVLGKKSGAAVLVYGKKVQLTCNESIVLTVPDTFKGNEVSLTYAYKQIRGERASINAVDVVRFIVPKMDFQTIEFKTNP